MEQEKTRKEAGAQLPGRLEKARAQELVAEDAIVSDKKLLRFTPKAWAKLQLMLKLKNTEVGGFGITDKHDYLKIEDILIPKQVCTSASIEFDNDDLAVEFDKALGRGLQPYQYSRIWIHTHPGSSAAASSTDKSTFKGPSFSRANYMIMSIVARTDNTATARLRYNPKNGLPAAYADLDTIVDYTTSFEGVTKTDIEEWTKVINAKVGPGGYQYNKGAGYTSYLDTEVRKVGPTAVTTVKPTLGVTKPILGVTKVTSTPSGRCDICGKFKHSSLHKCDKCGASICSICAAATTYDYCLCVNCARKEDNKSETLKYTCKISNGVCTECGNDNIEVVKCLNCGKNLCWDCVEGDENGYVICSTCADPRIASLVHSKNMEYMFHDDKNVLYINDNNDIITVGTLFEVAGKLKTSVSRLKETLAKFGYCNAGNTADKSVRETNVKSRLESKK